MPAQFITAGSGGKKPDYNRTAQCHSPSISLRQITYDTHLKPVHFSSVHDGIYALGKAHNHYTLHPVCKKFPQLCLSCGSNVRPIDDGPLSSFQGRSSSASSFHASLFQAISGAMSSALCPQVVSQASQHFKSSEQPATCEGCFARQSISSVISLETRSMPYVSSLFCDSI